jgi:hypothetical protein
MKRASGRLILLTLVATLFLAGAISAPAQDAKKVPEPPALHLTNSAIQVEQIQSEDVKLPAEFQFSMYENVIEQLNKSGRFQHVYRDGDRDAASAPDLVTLLCTVTGFKKGSAQARQVTTVAGKTSISVHLVITDKSGTKLLERDVQGKVRFFGENLRATYDFSKKVGAVVKRNFLAKSSSKK